MTEARKAMFSFTKLVVNDLEKMARFYDEVYGFKQLQRVKAQVQQEPIDEIIMGPPGQQGPTMTESLVLFKFVNRPKVPIGEVILGFITPDLAALIGRVRANGGSVVQEAMDLPEHGVRVAFLTDPEGHLTEVVQLLAA